PLVSPTATATYNLKEINSYGCSRSNSVIVTVNTLPDAFVNMDTAICRGISVNLGGKTDSGSSYTWISSPTGFSSTTSNPYVNPISTTSYTLTETDSKGCKNSDSVKITVNPLPLASVIHDTDICAGSSISIGAASVSGNSYLWF